MATGNTVYRNQRYTDWSSPYITTDEGTTVPGSVWSHIYHDWTARVVKENKLDKDCDWDPETN